MTWEILLGLITLAGCLVSIGTILAKLIKTLTTLDVTLKNLQLNIQNENETNRKSHERLWGKIDNHENRIHTLECKESKE